jgi:hypothetical protein
MDFFELLQKKVAEGRESKKRKREEGNNRYAALLSSLCRYLFYVARV